MDHLDHRLHDTARRGREWKVWLILQAFDAIEADYEAAGGLKQAITTAIAATRIIRASSPNRFLVFIIHAIGADANTAAGNQYGTTISRWDVVMTPP
jgi:hypothetical protein